MGGMFDQANIFNQPIGSWNVSNVIAMGYMFRQAIIFNQPIGSWNVGNVTNMSNMFSNASAFNQPIDSWNVSSVIDMDSMFFNDPMFFGPSSFDQPIGSWNVGNVTNMSSMFAGAQLSINNYDALLIGWATIAPNENPLEPNVVFSGGNSYYCNGYAARTSILNTYNWTITDLGLAINCSDLATEVFDTSSLQLYPNPALSVLNIKVEPSIVNQPYTIIDNLGRVVLNGKLNEFDTAINVEQLSKGIYYLKVSDRTASKFIKE
jgi:surface protein